MQRTKNSYTKQAGFTLFELLVVVIIIGILGSIAIANVVRSRSAANAASAVQTLRTYSHGEAAYQSSIGNGQYGTPQDLFQLNVIDESVVAASVPLTRGINSMPKHGYFFSLINSTEPVTNYQISATQLGNRNDKNFFVDATGIIRVSTTSTPPDANSLPLN